MPLKKRYSRRTKSRRYSKRNYRRSRYSKSNVIKKTDKLMRIDNTVNIMNQTSPRQIMTVSKTLSYPNAFRISPSQSGQGFTLRFDPSGNYGNTSITAGPASMPDWTSLASVFDFYKVNYIKLHMFIDTTASLDTDPVQVYMRYNYEPSVITPTLQGMEQLPKVIRKVFNSNSPRYTYVIRPHQLSLATSTVQSATALTTDNVSWGLKRHQWTDVNKPCMLYGFQFFFDNTTASQIINFEIEYNVSFRYGK